MSHELLNFESYYAGPLGSDCAHSVAHCSCGWTTPEYTGRSIEESERAALMELTEHRLTFPSVKWPYLFEGKLCRISGNSRTNNHGGKRGWAWYSVVTITFEDGTRTSMTATQFNGKAQCADCGRKTCRCKPTARWHGLEQKAVVA